MGPKSQSELLGSYQEPGAQCLCLPFLSSPLSYLLPPPLFPSYPLSELASNAAARPWPNAGVPRLSVYMSRFKQLSISYSQLQIFRKETLRPSYGRLPTPGPIHNVQDVRLWNPNMVTENLVPARGEQVWKEN